MAKYLVTGGAGFIGSHLTDALLARGDEVVVLDNLSTGKRSNLDHRVALYVADVGENPEIVACVAKTCDGIFHLAAVASVQRSNEDWLGTHKTNQTGTISVLDAARAAGAIPVVYASSASVYGQQDCPILHEGLRPAPQTAYGADKLGSELHGAVAWGVHRVPTVGFRFMNIYGPRQDPSSPYSGVISIFSDRVFRGVPLTVFGDGAQVRDFVYVGDVVSHLLAGMEMLSQRPCAEVLNVASGLGTTVLELAHAVGVAADRDVEIAHAPARLGDMRAAIGSWQRASDKLGVRAMVTLAEGLARTVRAA